MRARNEPPSMLELSDFFKKKREMMWKQNDGSEFEDNPCYRRIVARASTVQTSVEQRTNAIETGRDQPLRSTQTRRSTKVYEARISLVSHEMEEHLCNTAAENRNCPRFSNVAGKLTEFRKSDDTEISLDEDYFTLEDHNLFRAGPSQKQQVCTKGDHCSQAAQLYRSAYDEMSPPRKDERSMYRKEIPQELRRDSRGCSPHYEAIYLPTVANTTGCRSQHQASYQSPSQVNAQGYSSYNQVQGPAEKKSEPAVTRRQKDTRGTPGCSSRNQESYQSPSPQANQVQGPAEKKSEPAVTRRQRDTRGAPGCSSRNQESYQSPSRKQTRFKGRQKRKANQQSHGGKETLEVLQAVVHETKKAISHPARKQTNLANTPGCSSRNQASYQSPSQANAQGYSTHNQVQGRKLKRTTSYTATNVYVEQSMPQRNQMGRPSPRRTMTWPHTQTIQPPLQHAVTRGGTALPRQLNRIDERPHQPRLPARRYGVQEVCEARTDPRGTRRIGICQDTDKSQEHRRFVRVLSKRF
ncbi:hypothetical protein OS493_013694 [Desmophyllum pertusum]|uniref:Uncharacterized protein n=1 Tax=Desmophyllum pertusum TaxID=174260 RepID=A0A9W9ZPS7_9CNID|nr:hypothetical protein OS493_013694 [Desmophyllum pertusum]